mmetsp:Transcript_12064/g.51955  ORF Transcript_12064/g.51955 Transcript_12064/m.51955 type:complete len:200 (+) Transcript_12064:264-863(+)
MRCTSRSPPAGSRRPRWSATSAPSRRPPFPPASSINRGCRGARAGARPSCPRRPSRPAAASPSPTSLSRRTPARRTDRTRRRRRTRYPWRLTCTRWIEPRLRSTGFTESVRSARLAACTSPPKPPRHTWRRLARTRSRAPGCPERSGDTPSRTGGITSRTRCRTTGWGPSCCGSRSRSRPGCCSRRSEASSSRGESGGR